MTADATLPADYPDLGRLLRESRESVAMSLGEAAERLKIRPSFVEALESGDLARLPGEVYARGYFRAYAELLGYDSANLLGRIAAPPPKPQATRYLPQERPSHGTPPLVAGAAVLLVGLALWWAFSGRDDADAPPRVAPLPEAFDPLLDRGTPRVSDALPRPCLEVSGEAATRLCAGGEWFVARRLNDGVPSLLALPRRFPLWQAPPAEAAPARPDEADEAPVRSMSPRRPRYVPPAAVQPTGGPVPASPEADRPLWMRQGRFQ